MVRAWYLERLIPPEGDREVIHDPSLGALSMVSGIPLRTLEDRSRREGWVAQRDDFSRRVQEAESARMIKVLADQHAKVRSSFFRKHLRFADALERHLVNVGEDGIDPRVTSAFASAGTALSAFQKGADLAVLGPVAAQGPAAAQANVQVNVGWAAVSGTPPPDVEAMLASLESKDK